MFSLSALGLSGCASWRAETVTTCTEEQQEIGRLREQLAWKDAEISRLQTHLDARVKEREETTVQAARAEVKLRRFASEAEVASRLAEAEVALQALQARPDAPESPLQGLARQLLDKALAAFQRGEHSEAADFTAQTRQLIDMQLANEAAPDRQAAPKSSFKVAIPLRIQVDARLRSQPGAGADVLAILPAATLVTAVGFHGLWLQVQAPNRATGWVSSKLVMLP
ncbi:MAG: SH3 domain-containing protein [Xanthomonadaceae bacterium]|nr:SH3 domain-containing protein [Xanthomonadaceae bacterium]